MTEKAEVLATGLDAGQQTRNSSGARSLPSGLHSLSWVGRYIYFAPVQHQGQILHHTEVLVLRSPHQGTSTATTRINETLCI